jgi:hypothetical protein
MPPTSHPERLTEVGAQPPQVEATMPPDVWFTGLRGAALDCELSRAAHTSSTLVDTWSQYVTSQSGCSSGSGSNCSTG